MIQIFATGFIAEQPEIKYVGDTPKLEFKVLDSRREKSGTEYKTVWERVIFELWGDEALHHAERLTKGRNVEVCGHQITKSWTDANTGKTVYRTIYGVDRLTYVYKPSSSQSEQADNAPQERSANTPRHQPAPAQQRRPAPQQRSYGERTQAAHADPEPKPLPKAAGRSRFASAPGQTGQSPRTQY